MKPKATRRRPRSRHDGGATGFGPGRRAGGLHRAGPAVRTPGRAGGHAFAGAAAVDAAPVADLAWRQFFTDARLQQLIGLALQGNRDLRLAALAIEQARAQAQVRDADRWPSVSAGLAGTQAPTATGSSNRLYTAGVQVTAWELDLFGRLRGLSDAARRRCWPAWKRARRCRSAWWRRWPAPTWRWRPTTNCCASRAQRWPRAKRR
jgi:hypothetical protein